MILKNKSKLIFAINLVLIVGFQLKKYKRAAIDGYKVLDEITKAKTLPACCMACIGSRKCKGVKFDQNTCKRLSCLNFNEDGKDYAFIDEVPSNATYFSMPGPFKPSRNNHVHTFKEFGSDYTIKFQVVVNSFQEVHYNNILQITDGCEKNRVQCRQPHLNVDNQEKRFKLYSSHDLTENAFGKILYMPGIQLDTVYDMVIQQVNGKVEWIVNSELIGTFINSKPRSFVGMKVFLGSPFVNPMGMVSC